MAVPDYFRRNAVAIAQVISGLDERRLQTVLGDVCVGVSLGSDAGGREGRAVMDLLVRLLARLYPSISVYDESNSGADCEAAELARRVNPRINLLRKPTIEVAIGSVSGRRSAPRTVFAGCGGSTARLSNRYPQACGNSNNPFGAGLTACLAAADVFRHVFLPGAELSGDLEFTVPLGCVTSADDADVKGHIGSLVLAGAGAIGNAAAWALSRAQVCGSIRIVDDESIDLGNLQRYVLAERDAENKPKAEIVAGKFVGTLTAEAYMCRLAEFFERKGSRTDVLLLALDSANDRRAAQASLPRRICNAWTQQGDVGVSVHSFTNGACVNCLYLPESQQRSEDVIVAESFGILDRLQEVRSLLHKDEGAPRGLLEAIAVARGITLESLLSFEGRTLRDLYSEGFCGGAVIPLDRIGVPTEDVHVPLAHQSALGGVLLAASAVKVGLTEPDRSMVVQFDVLKPQERFQVYPVAKDSKGRCICQDDDYVEVYREKYKGLT